MFVTSPWIKTTLEVHNRESVYYLMISIIFLPNLDVSEWWEHNVMPTTLSASETVSGIGDTFGFSGIFIVTTNYLSLICEYFIPSDVSIFYKFVYFR